MDLNVIKKRKALGPACVQSACQVVGGAGKGGILVRKGQELTLHWPAWNVGFGLQKVQFVALAPFLPGRKQWKNDLVLVP